MKVRELLPKISSDAYIYIRHYLYQHLIESGYTDIENFTTAQELDVVKIDVYDEYSILIWVK